MIDDDIEYDDYGAGEELEYKTTLSDEEILSAKMNHGEPPTGNHGIVDKDTWLAYLTTVQANKVSRIVTDENMLTNLINLDIMLVNVPVVLFNSVPILIQTHRAYSLDEVVNEFKQQSDDNYIFLWQIIHYPEQVLHESVDEVDFVTIIQHNPPVVLPEYFMVRYKIIPKDVE
jgi:hypothetical protein